jgi:hypothetical protein
MTIRLGREFKWHMAGIGVLILSVMVGYITGGDDDPTDLPEEAAALDWDTPCHEDALLEMTPTGEFAPLHLAATEADAPTYIAGR